MISTKIEPLIIACASVILAAFGLTGYAIHSNQIAISEANRALCNQKAQYQNTISTTRAYLIKHPDGAPALGISAAQLQRSILLNTKQLAALKDVPCSP